MEKSMPNFSNEKEFAKRMASDIVSEIESKNFSLLISEWGCRAFANISAVAMQNHNPELLADFLDGGACEVLISLMYKYSAESQVVACYGCATILHLAWSSRDLREFFGEISACEIVIHAITMHIGDPDVSEYGSGAVGILSKQNISNSFKLAQAGACDAMVQVGNFGFCLRHPRCQNVAANVCFALAQFAEAVNTTRLLECGACELITQLLRLHSGVERIVKRAVRAICSLASLNFQLRESLGQCGACELIIDALRQYKQNIIIVQEGCEAIMHLSLSPTNTQRLGEAGGCEVIVTSLRDQLMENFQGAEVCSGAMLNLVTYGTAAMDNRARLMDAGAVDELKRAHMSTKASYRSRESGLQLQDILSVGTSKTRSRCSSKSSVGGESATITSSMTSNGSSQAVDALIGTTASGAIAGGGGVEERDRGVLNNVGVVSYPNPVNGRSNSFRGIVLGSEAKYGIVPLNVEVRVYESFAQPDAGSPLYMKSPAGDTSAFSKSTRGRGYSNPILPLENDNGVLEI